MPINIQVWARELAKKLFPDNSITNNAKNDDKYATASKVTLPQAGANPDVLVNNTSYPLTPVQRTDTILEYPVDTLETVPHIITGLEELSLSYDKRADILASHVASLNTKSAVYCIHKWSPAATITDRVLRTTGAARPAIVKGASGDRKMIELAQIIEAAALLDDADVPEDGRILFLPARMKNDLLKIADVRKKETFGIETLPSGIVARIMGFKIMYRSQAGIYDNAVNPVAVDMLASPAPTLTDVNAAALAFHPDFVRKGFYNAKVNIGHPQASYSGGQDMNAIMKLGASPSYTDFTGVISIVEDHA